MGYFLLKALAAVKEYGLIYELLLSEDSHSWSNMVREGATTCFEAWGKEQKWNTSLCHPWASAPISVLIEDVIGLQPAAPGWSEISFLPNIPQSLESFSLELSVNTGRIYVEYEKGHIRIQAPEGIKIVRE